MNNYNKQSTFPQSASEWFTRLRSSEISEETNHAFEEWLDADPNNETEYEQCEMITEMALELRDDPELTPFLEECNKDVDQYIKSQTKIGMMKKHANQIIASLTSIAAVITLTFFLLQPEVFETKVGEQRIVMLDDKSLIRLNTNTKVSVNYSDGERLITLSHGEAMFEVIPDKNRPFRVLAEHGSAIALGTIFNVKIHKEKVTVAVVEGKVSVASSQLNDTSSNWPILAIGEAISFQNSVIDNQTHKADIKRIIGWREGKIVFDNIPLLQAIEEHNRYTLKHITLGENQLESLTISGVFRVGDTKSLLFLLKNTLHLKAVLGQKGITLYSKKNNMELKKI